MVKILVRLLRVGDGMAYPLVPYGIRLRGNIENLA